MDGVFNCELSAIVNGFPSSSSAFAPSTTITNTTPTISNDQMLDDDNDIDCWDVDHHHHRAIMGNIDDFHSSTFDATANTGTPSSILPAMPINNNNNNNNTIIDLGIHEVINRFYPHVVTTTTSSLQTSFGDHVTNYTTNIPTITNTPTNYISPIHNNNNNNVQTVHDQRGSLDDDDDTLLLLLLMANTTTTTFGSSPPLFAASTTTSVPMTTTITTTTTPYQQINSSSSSSSNFQTEFRRLNLNQPMNEKNIRRLLLQINSNNNNNNNMYPPAAIINLSKPQAAAAAPLSNWPLFSIPGFGKLPEEEPTTTQQIHHHHQLGNNNNNNCSTTTVSSISKLMFGQTSSKSDKRFFYFYFKEPIIYLY